MKFTFTKNNTIGSRLICWALNEPVSHVAIQLSNGIVIHSKLLTGVVLDWHTQFTRTNQVLFTVTRHLSPTLTKQLVATVLDNYSNRSYDYGAVCYFAWRVLLFKLFKIPYPTKFKWSSSKKFMCTELALLFTNKPSSDFITPYTLYKELTSGRL